MNRSAAYSDDLVIFSGNWEDNHGSCSMKMAYMYIKARGARKRYPAVNPRKRDDPRRQSDEPVRRRRNHDPRRRRGEEKTKL